MTAGARLWLALFAALLAGCASVPQASSERDAQAKQFVTNPRTSTLYVFRDGFSVGGMGIDGSELYVDRRLIGSTLPGSFFRIDLRPGKHFLNGYAFDQGKMTLETRPGELYFVKLTVADGNSAFALVDPEAGKHEILRCCSLMENWTPGQRPFLR